MDIWVKTTEGNMINLSNVHGFGISHYENLSGGKNYFVFFSINSKASDREFYKTEQRAKEVIQLIQDHINAIGTNNFNNFPMVYVMPIE